MTVTNNPMALVRSCSVDCKSNQSVPGVDKGGTLGGHPASQWILKVLTQNGDTCPTRTAKHNIHFLTTKQCSSFSAAYIRPVDSL